MSENLISIVVVMEKGKGRHGVLVKKAIKGSAVGCWEAFVMIKASKSYPLKLACSILSIRKSDQYLPTLFICFVTVGEIVKSI